MPDTIVDANATSESVVGTLHVCAVPIGNLDDASARLRRVLGEVDAIACEDTRMTGRLLDLLGVDPKPRLLAHHAHNERASADGVVALLLAGSSVALVSDAGTPSVSDPGSALVRVAHASGVSVVAVAGPSAVAAAVSVAGVQGDGYRFVGFLPRSERELHELLARGAGEVLVAFESPRRVRATLERLEALQPARGVTVCRELTKLHEQVVHGTAEQVLEALAPEVRGELVLVLAPLPVAAPTSGVDPGALELVHALVAEGMRLKVATRIAAQHVGGVARELYDAANAERDG